MSDLGAELESLRKAALRFSDGAHRLNAVASHLSAQSAVLSNRYAVQRQHVDALSASLHRRGATLQRFSNELESQRRDQERVSGDGGHIGRSLVGHSSSTLIRGIPRVARAAATTGLMLEGWTRVPSGAGPTRLGLWIDFAKNTKRQVSIAKKVTLTATSFSRAYVKSPRAPRTLKGFLTLRVSKVPRALALQKVTSKAASVKHLKKAKTGAKSLVGLGAAALLQQSGNKDLQFAGDGLEKGLSVVSGAKSALSGVGKVAKGAGKVSKVSGAFAIIGGGIGLAETYDKYRTGKISGAIALRDGGLNAASMVGGALLLFPATAPAGAVVLVASSAVQAGIWIYDNRQRIGAYEKQARKPKPAR